MERLLVERLQEKCGYIETLLERNNNHWEETFYLLTCRYFGMKTNAQPFEWLAERLPLQLLSKHKNNPIQVEAMVFGVAGFLEEGNDDPYINLMKREFDFLKQKYGLVPLDKSTWKFARTRPSNFPVVRLAQLAALICRSSHLLSKVLEAETIRELASLYLAEPNPRLDPFMLMPHETKAKQGPIGAASVEVLLINTVLPVLFLYGKRNGKEELSERALRFYEDLKAEDNAITRFWQSLNVQVKSSFESQALIQLKNSHCANLKCLGCIIGNEILLS